MYHQALHLLFLVSLYDVLALDGLGDTHGARNINTENNGDVLIAAKFFILNLGGSLNQIVHFIVFWDLFIINEYLVLLVTELTLPHSAVLSHYWFQHAMDIQHCIAFLAQYGIACGHHASVLQTTQRNLKDICISFDNILIRRSSFLFLTPTCLEG